MAEIVGGQVMLSTNPQILEYSCGWLLVGAIAGAINGALVCYANLNSIVVTLGSLSAWGGLALYVTDGQTVSGLPDAFTGFGRDRYLGIPLEIFLLAAAIVYGFIVLTRMPTVGVFTQSVAMPALRS